MRTTNTPNQEFELCEPDPAALIESLRAFGYSAESAIADLVDNSITAKSKNIWIDFTWDGAGSTVAITDDGFGMSAADLTNAMRPGSTNPTATRAPDDLGRFGLGLKTASFSQCRSMTVHSSFRGQTSVRRWDLDVVAEHGAWRLLVGSSETGDIAAHRLAPLPHGTSVVWERMDRLVGDADVEDNAPHRRFLDLIARTATHLRVTFHRFLEGRGKRRIFVNGHELEAWDPFLKGHVGSQTLERETLPFRGEFVVVQPYVLPHRNRMTSETFEECGLNGRWNDLQGFYVYRNDRLLVAGDYLGLPFQKEEHYKLARIAVDISNRMDAEWQIDVRKSVARPPGVLRDDLRRIGTFTRSRAAEVYRHRGKVLTRQASHGVIPMWTQKLRAKKIIYALNREHPALTALFNASDKRLRRQIRALAALIEETVPVPLIAINAAEKQEELAAPFEGDSANLAKIARQMLEALTDSGMTRNSAVKRLASIDPFQMYPDVLAALLSEADNAAR